MSCSLQFAHSVFCGYVGLRELTSSNNQQRRPSINKCTVLRLLNTCAKIYPKNSCSVQLRVHLNVHLKIHIHFILNSCLLHLKIHMKVHLKIYLKIHVQLIWKILSEYSVYENVTSWFTMNKFICVWNDSPWKNLSVYEMIHHE